MQRWPSSPHFLRSALHVLSWHTTHCNVHNFALRASRSKYLLRTSLLAITECYSLSGGFLYTTSVIQGFGQMCGGLDLYHSLCRWWFGPLYTVCWFAIPPCTPDFQSFLCPRSLRLSAIYFLPALHLTSTRHFSRSSLPSMIPLALLVLYHFQPV